MVVIMSSSKNKNDSEVSTNNELAKELFDLWKQIDKGKRNSVIKADLKKHRDSSTFLSVIENIIKKKHWSFESVISSPNLFKFICEELNANLENYLKEVSLISIQYLHRFERALFDDFLSLTNTEIPGGTLDKAICKMDGT